MITGTEAEYQSDAVSQKTFLSLMGEPWGVFCEYLWENWLCYNSTALYYE